jgi:hypothetical protein
MTKREQGTHISPGMDEHVNKLLKKDFHPNLTPDEVLWPKVFGGTYFHLM